MEAPKNFNLDNVYTSPLSELENFCIEFEKYIEYIAETSSISVDDNAVKMNTKLEKSLITYGVVKNILTERERINDPEFESLTIYKSDYDELLGLLQDIQEHQFDIQDYTKYIVQYKKDVSEMDDYESTELLSLIERLEKLKENSYQHLRKAIKEVWELDIDINMKKVAINLFGLGKHLM